MRETPRQGFAGGYLPCNWRYRLFLAKYRRKTAHNRSPSSVRILASDRDRRSQSEYSSRLASDSFDGVNLSLPAPHHAAFGQGPCNRRWIEASANFRFLDVRRDHPFTIRTASFAPARPIIDGAGVGAVNRFKSTLTVLLDKEPYLFDGGLFWLLGKQPRIPIRTTMVKRAEPQSPVSEYRASPPIGQHAPYGLSFRKA